MERKIRNWLILVIVLGVYLNIGWVVENYYSTYILSKEPQTITQKVFAGGYNVFVDNHPSADGLPGKIARIIVWPFFLIVVLASWLIYIIHYLLWLIFWGGVAKLLGWA